MSCSFGLALLASQKSVTVDELDLEIPAAVEVEAQAPADEELPMLEDEIPAATGTAEDDLPDLD